MTPRKGPPRAMREQGGNRFLVGSVRRTPHFAVQNVEQSCMTRRHHRAAAHPFQADFARIEPSPAGHRPHRGI